MFQKIIYQIKILVKQPLWPYAAQTAKKGDDICQVLPENYRQSAVNHKRLFWLKALVASSNQKEII